MFTDEITILRPERVSGRYSTEPSKLDHGNATPIPVDFLVSIQPAGSTEGTVERPTTRDQWRLFTPEGFDLDLEPTDRIKCRHGVLAVDGNPGRWPDPRTGGIHHVEASLILVVG